jgi:putative ABC transport system permease protein
VKRDRSQWRRWRRVFQRDPADEIGDELEFHLENRIRDYVDGGMDPEAARKAALERMGDIERARIECTALLASERRAHERRVRLNVSWLDVKLGVRMVAKYPGLSLVSVLGMAVAIAIGAGVFGTISAMLDPTLPLPGGDRIVAVQNKRADRPGSPNHQVLHDLVAWRSELTMVRDLGAFRRTSRNLIIDGRGTDLVRIAEMSAAGFRVARIPPLLGRPLQDEDEHAGAPPVLVIGHREWQRRFDADPDIIGRTVRLGETVHTVVGVMPEGFRFPVNHGFWVPLRLDATRYEFGGGSSINVFGRLADGVPLDQARAQVAVIGRRMATAYPDTHQHLRPAIVPYAYAVLPQYDLDVDDPGDALFLYAIQLGISLLLVLVAANVAVLVYARTATRAGEIAVRTALGASRARVVAQLFVEALVLSLAAAALGLTVAVVALGWMERRMVLVYSLPFWFDLGVSGGLIAYVAGLAILGGTIVGVLPALKVTGRNAYGGLQQLAARGTQMLLGRTWTALIIVQVAIAVAVLPTTIYFASELIQYGMGESDYPAEEFFSAEPSLERAEAPPSAEADAYQRGYEARFADRADALMRRLAAEPGVDASFASELPGMEPDRWFEIEGGVATVDPSAATREATVRAAVSSVGAGFFELFDAPILAGRGFVDADAAEGSTSVIVDRSFAERMGGGNVVGRWIRDPRRNGSRSGNGERAPWLEIVGVVADLPSRTGLDDVALPRVYSAETPGASRTVLGVRPSIFLIVRARGGPTPDFTRRLRDIVASVEPGFQLHEMQNWAESERIARRTYRTVAVGVGLAMLSVLLLTAAGIYAMLSFTVARRRREIGIRIALGADHRRILGGIFARAATQLGVGVAVGLVLALALQWATGGRTMGNQSGVADGLLDAFILMPIVATIMMVVGLLAALGPARRGLAVQPTEALREE